jgi:H+-translocating NAD(P) transhydrogenase subunit alpha
MSQRMRVIEAFLALAALHASANLPTVFAGDPPPDRSVLRRPDAKPQGSAATPQVVPRETGALTTPGKTSGPGTVAEGRDAAADWYVFILSTIIGLGVVGRVSRLLHTPLMSLTNAISAIAVVGSIAVAGGDYPGPIRFLGAIALFASMTNIVSGFLITDRMLKMFRQTRPADSPPPTAPASPV